MSEVMQILFDHIIDHTLDTYCLQTKRMQYQVSRDNLSRKLTAQLTEEQQEMFEEYQKYSHQTQMEELYAMFLASFDQSAALLSRHTS